MAMKENPHYTAFIDSDEEDEDEIECEYQEMMNHATVESEESDDEDVDYNLNRSVMKKVVREITAKISGRKLQIAGKAFEVLRQEATNLMIGLFRCAKKPMTHAKRTTLLPSDIEFILDLKRELCGPASDLKKPQSPPQIDSDYSRKSENSREKCRYENTSIIDSYDLCIEPSEYKRRQTIILKKNGLLNKVVKKAKKPTKPTIAKNKNKNDVSVESMEVEKEKKVSSKKRKLEKIQEDDNENEEAERLLKIRREKREELKKKSKQIQEESMALIKKYKHDPDEYQYELELDV